VFPDQSDGLLQVGRVQASTPVFSGGERAGVAEGAGVAFGRVGLCAQAEVATKRRIVRLRRSIRRIELSRNRGKSNVATIMAAFESDLPDCLISSIPCRRDRVAEGRDREDAPAAAENFPVFPSRPGVENLHLRKLGRGCETGNFPAGWTLPG
jgi:hypothetical protein